MVNVQVDGIEDVQRALANIGRQAPFALALGITRTVQQAQQDMQDRMPKAFHLRGTEQLFRRAVKAKFATKANPQGNVRIEGPQSGNISTAGRIAQMILRHEEGGTPTSNALYRTSGGLLPLGFYLPVRGMRTIGSNVPRKLYPVNVGVTARVDPGGKVYYANSRKGKKIKRNEAQREISFFATRKGIYERRVTGFGSATRLVWAFQKSITLRPRLGFYKTVGGVVDKHLTPNLLAAIDEALRTAFQGPSPLKP